MLGEGTTALTYYQAQVKTYADYYPFGMEMEGRTASSLNYRYGFNGKEKDQAGEFSASQTHYDYGFRIYNPVWGKFLSVDPLSKSYPWYTPYQFAGNKPIIAIDLDGLEEDIIIIPKTKYEPQLDNLKPQSDPVISRVYRGSGENAEYKYAAQSLRFGEIEESMTWVQQQAYNKAMAAKKHYLAGRFFKHWLLGGGRGYLLNNTELKEIRSRDFSLQGPKVGPIKDEGVKKHIEKIHKLSIDGLSDQLAKMKVGDKNTQFSLIQAGIGLAGTPGTLGQFNVIFEGTLLKLSDTDYQFTGTFRVMDRWDFDVRLFKSTGEMRSPNGGKEVTKVAVFQAVTGNGADFNITSEPQPYTETGSIPAKPKEEEKKK
jgi:RHS repeat-associated protein